jgi:hypothetical protein
MEWAIMLDANDTLEGIPPPRNMFLNDCDAFKMDVRLGSIVHSRPHIFETASPWAFYGAVHEFARCDKSEGVKLQILASSCWMQTRCEGFRSKDPEKYLNDAKLLLKELDTKPNEPRSLFYLAQSFRDAHQKDIAKLFYKKRASISSGWMQEKYMSLVNLIQMSEQSGEEEQEQMRYAWNAIELCPERLEAPFALLESRRKTGKPFLMEQFCMACGLSNRTPNIDAHLFVLPYIYEWAFDDELAVCAFHTRQYSQGLIAAERSLCNAPQAHHERISGNIQHCKMKMQ